MHSWIQNHVLIELTRNSTRRYSELKPRDVEGNLFMYHLKGLIKEGLVEKHDSAYRLSQKGLQFAGYLSLQTKKTRQQPKILTTVICQNDLGEYLFVRWKRQPNTGLVSFPHGMMHYGVSPYEMAALELAEKAEYEADLTFKGDVYVTGVRDGEIDRHILVHVFEACNLRSGRHDEVRPDVCESFWTSATNIEKNEYVPGFYEIAQLAIASDIPRISEVTVEIESMLSRG